MNKWNCTMTKRELSQLKFTLLVSLTIASVLIGFCVLAMSTVQ